MENTVLSFIKKHRLLHKNSTVIVGVSGGPDSMALLHFLCMMRESWKLKLIAASVDHGLRGEDGKADLAYVRRFCEEQGVIFAGTSRDVPAYRSAQKVGTQVAARELRYRFYKEQMQAHRADYLALGHHGDDQVETMLMNLVRTASSSSFSGIPVSRKFSTGLLIRPLLCVAKADISAYLKQQGIFPRLDPSNDDITYTRNYFRKEVLPLVKEKNNHLHRTVQQLSESLAADEQYLADQAVSFLHETVKIDEKRKTAHFKIDCFKSRALALQRRAYHLILNYLYKKLPGNLSYVQEEGFFALLASDKSNVRIDFPDCLKIEKSYGICTFYFQRHDDTEKTYHLVLHVPGEVTLPDGAVITAAYTDIPYSEDAYTYIYRMKEVAMPLNVRTRKQGDRMSWRGLNGTKKVKDVFIDAKIPPRERETWPLVTDHQDTILWLAGLKKGQPAAGSQAKGSAYIKLTYKKTSARFSNIPKR